MNELISPLINHCKPNNTLPIFNDISTLNATNRKEDKHKQLPSK